MRIRTIKPEFYTHEVLFELEQETGMPIRVAFTGLWCIADREGRFKWQPRRIGAQILPYDGVDFSRVLDALLTRGLIQKYESQGEYFGHIPTFNKHQVINNRERESELPSPSESSICDASGTRGARVGHAGKAEGKGMEGNGTEGKGKDNMSGYPDAVEQIWKEYPQTGRARSTRKKVHTQWKAMPKDSLDQVLHAIRAWSKSHNWQKDGGQFVPALDRWLRDRGYEDLPHGYAAAQKRTLTERQLKGLDL